MKKILSILLVMSVMLLTICGCESGGAPENQGNQKLNTEEKQKVEETPEIVKPDEGTEEVKTPGSDPQGEVEPQKNDTLTPLQDGDFSLYAGTYAPLEIYHDWYGGGERLPNLILQKDGTVTGGLVYGSYPATPPISVTENEDGSILCQVSYESNSSQNYFVIYPEDVLGEYHTENASVLTNSVYIQYMSLDGGVMDIIYLKTEHEGVAAEAADKEASSSSDFDSTNMAGVDVSADELMGSGQGQQQQSDTAFPNADGGTDSQTGGSGSDTPSSNGEPKDEGASTPKPGVWTPPKADDPNTPPNTPLDHGTWVWSNELDMWVVDHGDENPWENMETHHLAPSKEEAIFSTAVSCYHNRYVTNGQHYEVSREQVRNKEIPDDIYEEIFRLAHEMWDDEPEW